MFSILRTLYSIHKGTNFTLKEIMKELIRTLRLNGTTLRIYDENLTRGSRRLLSYEFKVGRKILFSGNDFSPSPLFADDSLQTAYSILSFLTLGIHDTDKEYFENYNEEQLEWANSYKREYLSYIVSNWEEKHRWD